MQLEGDSVPLLTHPCCQGSDISDGLLLDMPIREVNYVLKYILESQYGLNEY